MRQSLKVQPLFGWSGLCSLSCNVWTSKLHIVWSFLWRTRCGIATAIRRNDISTLCCDAVKLHPWRQGPLRLAPTFESARPFWSFFREPCWNSLKYPILSVNRRMSQCLSWTLTLVYVCTWVVFSLPHLFMKFLWETYLKQVSRHVGLKDLGGPPFCLKNRAQTSIRKAPRASKMCFQMQLVLSGLIESYTSTKPNVPRLI